MIDGARIAVLIPAFNEERQIVGVLQELPKFIDHVVVIDDASTDDTRSVVERHRGVDPRVHLVALEQNRGVGGALAEGYEWARRSGVDIAVSIDGDGQMDPTEIRDLIEPLLNDEADYTKGNRLAEPASWRAIPRVRLFGNAVLSVLTKIASGYWSVADSQSGYTAAGRYALDHIPWLEVYPRYGRPNDVLVLANLAECRVADVPIRPIYGVGERSSMKILKVTFAIGWLLVRRFWWRLGRKYILRDFHPLVFFYLLSAVTGVLGLVLTGRLFALWVKNGSVPPTTALAVAFLLITTLNSVFFGFWMDMEANEHLAVRLHRRRPPAAKATNDECDSPVGQGMEHT